MTAYRKRAERIRRREAWAREKRRAIAQRQLDEYSKALEATEDTVQAINRALQVTGNYKSRMIALVAEGIEDADCKRLDKWAAQRDNISRGKTVSRVQPDESTDARIKAQQLSWSHRQLRTALARTERQLLFIRQRGPLLRGALHLIEQQDRAPDACEEDIPEDPRQARDKEIMTSLNPHATEEDAEIRYNNKDGHTSEVSDPFTFYIQMDVDDTDTVHAMMDMHEDESDEGEREPEPLFAVRAANPKSAGSFQSMTAQLDFEDTDGARTKKTVVVDSGAAACTTTLEEVRKLPGVMSTMRRSRRRFTDAQGRLLPIVGWVTMKLWLGECPLECKVYVFETMGVPFLLGTNALWENGLVIDAHEETLYKSPGLAGSMQCSTALSCRRPTPTGANVIHEVEEAVPACPAWY